MTESKLPVITYDIQGNQNKISKATFQKLIREGDPRKRNLRVFQQKKTSETILILERERQIERRFSNGYILYEFILGKDNSVMKGNIYLPGINRTPQSVVRLKDADTIDKIRFGRNYGNYTTVVEFY